MSTKNSFSHSKDKSLQKKIFLQRQPAIFNNNDDGDCQTHSLVTFSQ